MINASNISNWPFISFSLHNLVGDFLAALPPTVGFDGELGMADPYEWDRPPGSTAWFPLGDGISRQPPTVRLAGAWRYKDAQQALEHTERLKWACIHARELHWQGVKIADLHPEAPAYHTFGTSERFCHVNHRLNCNLTEPLLLDKNLPMPSQLNMLTMGKGMEIVHRALPNQLTRLNHTRHAGGISFAVLAGQVRGDNPNMIVELPKWLDITAVIARVRPDEVPNEPSAVLYGAHGGFAVTKPTIAKESMHRQTWVTLLFDFTTKSTEWYGGLQLGHPISDYRIGLYGGHSNHERWYDMEWLIAAK